jgi:hypothetical protein
MPFPGTVSWHELGLASVVACNFFVLLFNFRAPSRGHYFDQTSSAAVLVTTTTSGSCVAQLQEALDWRASSLWWRTCAYWAISLWVISAVLVCGLIYYYLQVTGRSSAHRSSGRSISSSAKPLRGSKRE